MKALYFGDHQDLPKWGILAHLLEKKKLKEVCHVAFYRDDGLPKIRIVESGTPDSTTEIDEGVWSFFRDVESLGNNGNCFPIRHYLESFEHRERQSYVDGAIEWLGDGEKRIVFLDPDTGIEPSSGLKPEHLQEGEVKQFWDLIESGEILAIYQHSPRRGKEGWITKRRHQLARVLGVGVEQVCFAHGERLRDEPASAILYLMK